MRIGFTKLLIPFIFFALAMVSSCQKDADLKDPDSVKIAVAADSSTFSSAGNLLASSGTLTVRFNDSVYTFDAAKDSIAFINVRTNDTSRYFGITAINKAHSISFGISAAGAVAGNINKSVAGSQFLLNADDKTPALQFSLSGYSMQQDFGNINVVQYNQGNILAKGTFYTFLATSDKPNAPSYRVDGTFDLRVGGSH